MVKPITRSLRLTKSDPVHRVYRQVLELKDLDPELKTHLRLAFRQFLRPHQQFIDRIILSAGLTCFLHCTLLNQEIVKERIGSDRYRSLSAQYRAWSESLAKSYRLRGLKAPPRWRKDPPKRPVDFSRGGNEE